jgi:signal transduction histidine kinase
MTSPELASESANSPAYPSSPSSPGSSSPTPHDDGEKDSFLRTEFLHRLAHDLRGHAGVIHGALQELEAASDAQAGASSTFFGMAKRGVKRILRTADRLQQTGQLERGTPSLTPTECDVRVLVQQASEEAHNIEGRKKISVELDMPAVIVGAYADTHWLTSAFFELASNAIRHAQTRVRITVIAQPDQVSVEFSDDGRAAGPFGPTRFKAPRDRRGLGLGLSLVHDVAQAHGGSLQIAYARPEGSDPFGAKVTLSVPRRDSHSRPAVT